MSYKPMTEPATPRPCPLEFIRWEDHATQDGWEVYSDCDSDRSYVDSVGFNIMENDNHVVLAASVHAASSASVQRMFIVKRTIVKRFSLDEVVKPLLDKEW